MFYTKNDKQQVLDSTKKITELTKKMTELTKIVDVLFKKNNNLQKEVNILLDLKKRKESDEPWIDLTGGDIDPTKGIQLKLDWNDAFINQLRSQGYRGVSETELVGQYLLQLSNIIAADESSSQKEDN